MLLKSLFDSQIVPSGEERGSLQHGEVASGFAVGEGSDGNDAAIVNSDDYRGDAVVSMIFSTDCCGIYEEGIALPCGWAFLRLAEERKQ